MSTKVKLYIISTAISAALGAVVLLGAPNRVTRWRMSLILVPAVFWIVDWMWCSYRSHLKRLKDERRHVTDMAGVHLRTIEALALAIEGKDYTSHTQFRRIEAYAVEIGRELRLGDLELKALRAAVLLHDIGKLAVPEPILSKPGPLSAMEFEKMKIHPLVGAEIIEQVDFPYPVAPIVRSHHEKWDGTGYPEGLSGEDIPIGARILAAVDCLDALSSHRQYRPAISVGEALAHVTSESGKSFDPRVVEALARLYMGLEQKINASPARSRRIQSSESDSDTAVLKKSGNFAPPVVFSGHSESGGFLNAIAAARQEAQTLYELMHELGNSLSLDETLSVLALRLKRMCPYDCIAIYIRRENKLIPEYVSGENFHLFSSLEIPVGEGLSGWVAEHRAPIVNGNPSVEPGYLNDAGKFSTLSSALSAPLEGIEGVVGVLTLYHSRKDVFTQDHLRILLALTNKVALSIENALRYRQAETCAVTDGLTGLPNARSLFLHLDGEIARCKRDSSPLTVLVCDLDGFKRVNDRFGHLEGNKVLRTVAQGLRDNCREYDYVARMGGDEFVVVLPGHPVDAVRTKIRHLCEVAVQAARSSRHDIGWLSMSVGEATFPADGLDAEQLLAEADRRMYYEKNQRWRLNEVREPGNPRDRTFGNGLAFINQ